MKHDFRGIHYNQKTLICQNFLRSWKSISLLTVMLIDNKVQLNNNINRVDNQ